MSLLNTLIMKDLVRGKKGKDDDLTRVLLANDLVEREKKKHPEKNPNHVTFQKVAFLDLIGFFDKKK